MSSMQQYLITKGKSKNIFIEFRYHFIPYKVLVLSTVKIKESDIPKLIKEGKDRQVIPLLYKKVFPILEKKILRYSGDKEDAYDSFQEALVKFYRQIMEGTFDPKYKVYGYLYRIGLNIWINKAKREQRMQPLGEIDMEDLATDPQTNMDFEQAAKWESHLLESLFSNLGQRCLELLNYTIFKDMLLEDVALRMQFPSVDAAKMQQMRCKQKLIREIEKNPKILDRLQQP